MNEVENMRLVAHPNIVNIIEFSKDGIKTKKDGSKQAKVIYMVLELCTGGELFDYVAVGGRFSEGITRYYFQSLIQTLAHMHS